MSLNKRGRRLCDQDHTIRSAAVEDNTAVQVEDLQSLAEAAQKAADLGAQVHPFPSPPHPPLTGPHTNNMNARQ